ncbi:MAG: hypothetical protein ACYSPJ_00110 [Planctomycetota bacterium]
MACLSRGWLDRTLVSSAHRMAKATMPAKEKMMPSDRGTTSSPQ